MQTHRRMIIGGAVVAAVVALLAVVDLVFIKPFRPFGGQIVFDVCAFFASLITLYLAHEAWKEVIGKPLFDSEQRTKQRNTPQSRRFRSPVKPGRAKGQRNSTAGART